MIRKKMAMLLVPVIVLAQVPIGGARADLILNGGFESSSGGNGNSATVGQLGYNESLANWTTSGYGFLMNPSSADSTGSPAQYMDSSGAYRFRIWGPNDGSMNGLTASPTGGNYVAGEDDASLNVPFTISQTVTGLTAGKAYYLNFYWAGAEQSQSTTMAATYEKWTVSFGSAASQSTSQVNIGPEGFSGWMQQRFTFVADGSSDALTFASFGGPTGSPPFSLLDGVTLVAVPEPSSVILVGLGLVGLAALEFRRRRARLALA